MASERESSKKKSQLPAKKKAKATPEEPELLPAAVSDDVIDQTIAELHGVYRDGLLDMTIDMGRVVVENLYDGSLDAWRSRGEKDSSFRKLAQRMSENGDSEVSKSKLSRAVRVYELEQRIPVSALKRIGASHCYAVLGLPDRDQEKLLERADKEGWTTRKLEDEAKKLRPGDGRGRKPLPAFQKGLAKMVRAIEEAASEPVPEDLFGGAYGSYSPEKARELLESVDEELEKLQALRREIQERIEAATDG